MYIIQEIQTTNGVAALLPAVTKNDKNEADSAYFSTLSFAAVSSVNVHTVIMYDEHGNVLRRDFYEHFPEPEPEVQTETPEPEGD